MTTTCRPLGTGTDTETDCSCGAETEIGPVGSTPDGYRWAVRCLRSGAEATLDIEGDSYDDATFDEVAVA